jgi:hypothetical protein
MCVNGLLYYSKETEPDPAVRARAEEIMKADGGVAQAVYYKPILMEGQPITCTACEGKGAILTPEGRELLVFFETFLRPVIYEICSDYIDDKMGLS